MKAKLLTILLLVFLSLSCQSEMDEMDVYNPITDTFLLVDYYEGVYKFVQVDNEYTIGVADGVLDIPADFKAFENEESTVYYQVDLKLTGINQENIKTAYQRYTGNSEYCQIRQAGAYVPVSCCIQRVSFFNDYLYYLKP